MKNIFSYKYKLYWGITSLIACFLFVFIKMYDYSKGENENWSLFGAIIFGVLGIIKLIVRIADFRAKKLQKDRINRY